MISSLKRLFGKKADPESLRGAPPVRREKTYSADTGYVYQYFYQGYREGRRADESGYEHIFSVTSDRSSRFPLTVFLGRRAVEAWQEANGRELTLTEQYAVVKLSLFQAFDDRENLGQGPAEVIVASSEVSEHCATLDL